jgi:hypothetical protein
VGVGHGALQEIRSPAVNIVHLRRWPQADSATLTALVAATGTSYRRQVTHWVDLLDAICPATGLQARKVQVQQAHPCVKPYKLT